MQKPPSLSICLEIFSLPHAQEVKAYLGEQFPDVYIYEGISTHQTDKSSPTLAVLEHNLPAVDAFNWLENHPVPEKVILLCSAQGFLPAPSHYQERILACLQPHQKSELSEQIATVIKNDPTCDFNQYQELNVLIDSAMDAIVIIDRHYRIKRLNPAGEQMFLISEIEIKNKPLNLLLPQRYRSKHNNKIKIFSKNGQSTQKMGINDHVYGLCSDGREFPIEVSILRFDLDGQLHFGAIITQSLRFFRKLGYPLKAGQSEAKSGGSDWLLISRYHRLMIKKTLRPRRYEQPVVLF